MDARKLSQNELDRVDESNLGHTKGEWGDQKDIAKIRIMEMYDLKWNTDKVIDELK